MKSPDIKSTLAAGVVGAVALVVLAHLYAKTLDDKTAALSGFSVGVVVQVAVRLLGVS